MVIKMILAYIMTVELNKIANIIMIKYCEISNFDILITTAWLYLLKLINNSQMVMEMILAYIMEIVVCI